MSIQATPPTHQPAPLLVASATATLDIELWEALQADGFAPLHALTGAHARALATQRLPRAVLIVDVQGARLSTDLLQEIRRPPSPRSPWDPGLPTVVVSDRDRQLDLLRAFEAGADDFLAWPLSYLELRARLRSLLRRAAPAGHQQLRIGALVVNKVTREVSVEGRPLALSRLEFELLTHLAEEPERVFTKQELLREVWGFRAQGATRTLDSHASRLRRKLTGAGGSWVVNVWGVGYRLT